MLHILHAGSEKKIKYYFSQVSITAKPFFEHFGFKVVKQHQAEVGDQVLTNFYMKKTADSEVSRLQAL